MISAPRKRPATLEDQHQIALIDWANRARLPDLENVAHAARVADYLFHIPNGGKRNKATAANLKRMGTKAGVSDLFLPIPVGGFAGLWIEMKAPYKTASQKNYPTEKQKEWLQRMELAGYRGVVCYGWFEARQAIENYLKGE